MFSHVSEIMTERYWKTIKTQLRNERGLWGQHSSGLDLFLTLICRLLTLSPLQSASNLHQFLVDDCTATTHPAACVWESEEDLAQTEEQTQLQEEVEQILPENGTILFTDHVLMIIPMQHVPGTLTLTRTSLSFIVDTEYITSMKQKITDLDAKIASGSFKGENKWRTLGLPENCAWPIEEFESEEFRLFEVWWNCGIIKIVFGFGSRIILHKHDIRFLCVVGNYSSEFSSHTSSFDEAPSSHKVPGSHS